MENGVTVTIEQWNEYKELQEFVADLRYVKVYGNVVYVDTLFTNDSDRYKLWVDLHLAKYPQNY